jgi:iron complex outermembrane recepter protein
MCEDQKPVQQSDNRIIIIPKMLRMVRIGLGIGLIALTGIARADETSRHYHIPPQALDSGLLRLAADSGLEILFTADKVRGVTGNNLDGNMTPAQALSQLLQGSGMTYRFVDAKTVTVEAPNPNLIKTAATVQNSEPQSSSNTTLPKVTVEANAGDPYDDPNWITDPYNTAYTVRNSSTATKTDTPLMETPQSITVVPRAVLEDQKVTRITDALENVSGVRAQPSLGVGNNFLIRGFSSFNVYRNGLRSNNDFRQEFDTANLQSIEVLKGPAQLYGRIEPGGLVNLTTKKPLDTPYYSLEQRFGSYDFYRTEWDATGPLNKDKTLLYRFTGAYQNNNSFRDFVFVDRMFFAPSITWKPTDATDATLELQVMNHDFMAETGIPAVGRRPAPIPINRTLGDPNTPKSNHNQVQLGTLLNHRFNEDWALHSRFLATYDHFDNTFLLPAPSFDPSAFNQATGFMQRNIFGNENDGEEYATNLDLTGKFDLGFSKHDILVGFDYYRAFQKYGNKGFYLPSDQSLQINVYNPGPYYGLPQSVFDAALSTSQTPATDRNMFFTEWEGVYFQDQITLWDKLHILGGGRYDWATTARGQGPTYSAADAQVDKVARNDEAFSPRVGILYQPIKELSLYGNWATSFGANNGIASTGKSYPPQIGEQFEAGIKTSLFNNRLLANLAYYHLVKDNILVPDFRTSDPSDSVSTNQRSQGIELDITGQITDSLSVIGSYAYTDARITKDISGLQGNRTGLVPEHAGSLWLKYDFSGHKALNGLSLGLGTVAAGQREGDNANSFELPGYVRLDAFAAYKWNIKKTRVTAQFNIRNLLDHQYYESTDPGTNAAPPLGIYPGAPLTAIGSLRVEF